MPSDGARIWRSPYINFYGDETLEAQGVYTAEFLEQVAAHGFNAIWIRGHLRELGRSEAFPDLGSDPTARRESLRTVIERGKAAGVGVYLYMQPPFELPANDPWWEAHEDVRGSSIEHFGETVSALCTSHPEVPRFLRQATADMLRALPGLAGLILITASEFHSHCWSHSCTNPEILRGQEPKRPDCPRCRDREGRELVNTILDSVYAGITDADSKAELVAWNWSWSFYEPEPQARIINRMPYKSTLMLGFERGHTKEILGKPRRIDEYCLSFAGPSERFLGALRVARRRQLDVMAKLQIGTTHELATVPNLPLLPNLYEKARGMRGRRLGSFMGCWNFGNMFTANTAAFNRFLTTKRLAARPEALEDFAADYLPGCDAATVTRAWEDLTEAMQTYPFGIPFLYNSPVNYAVAQPLVPAPLRPHPCGPSWLVHEDRGDELEQSFGEYTVDEIIDGLAQLWRNWQAATDAFAAAVEGCEHPHAGEEFRSMRMAEHCFRSCWNLYRAWPIRRDWSDAKRPLIEPIMRDELDHLPAAADLAGSDDRLGFHSECQAYLFTADTIKAKIANLRRTLGG